jgi:hypothetical protein
MPSRTKFLAVGLVPVLASASKTGDECSICTCQFSQAVKVSTCGHVFDQECIVKWLQMDGKNACPLCKCELFDLDSGEEYDPSTNRRELISSAFQISRIGELGSLDLINTYGIDSRIIPISSWQRATAQATYYVGQNHRSIVGRFGAVPGSTTEALVIGRVRVRTEKLAPSLLAMGNLVPALASAAGRQYDEQRSMDWSLIMKCIWAVLRSNEGKKMDVAGMAGEIDRHAKKLLSKAISDVNAIEFFIEHEQTGRRNELREDLFLLLNYLAVQCWRIQWNETASTQQEEAELARRRAQSGGLPMRGACVIM